MPEESSAPDSANMLAYVDFNQMLNNVMNIFQTNRSVNSQEVRDGIAQANQHLSEAQIASSMVQARSRMAQQQQIKNGMLGEASKYATTTLEHFGRMSNESQAGDMMVTGGEVIGRFSPGLDWYRSLPLQYRTASFTEAGQPVPGSMEEQLQIFGSRVEGKHWLYKNSNEVRTLLQNVDHNLNSRQFAAAEVFSSTDADGNVILPAGIDINTSLSARQIFGIAKTGGTGAADAIRYLQNTTTHDDVLAKMLGGELITDSVIFPDSKGHSRIMITGSSEHKAYQQQLAGLNDYMAYSGNRMDRARAYDLWKAESADYASDVENGFRGSIESWRDEKAARRMVADRDLLFHNQVTSGATATPETFEAVSNAVDDATYMRNKGTEKGLAERRRSRAVNRAREMAEVSRVAVKADEDIADYKAIRGARRDRALEITERDALITEYDEIGTRIFDISNAMASAMQAADVVNTTGSEDSVIDDGAPVTGAAGTSLSHIGVLLKERHSETVEALRDTTTKLDRAVELGDDKNLIKQLGTEQARLKKLVGQIKFFDSIISYHDPIDAKVRDKLIVPFDDATETSTNAFQFKPGGPSYRLVQGFGGFGIPEKIQDAARFVHDLNALAGLDVDAVDRNILINSLDKRLGTSGLGEILDIGTVLTPQERGIETLSEQGRSVARTILDNAGSPAADMELAKDMMRYARELELLGARSEAILNEMSGKSSENVSVVRQDISERVQAIREREADVSEKHAGRNTKSGGGAKTFGSEQEAIVAGLASAKRHNVERTHNGITQPFNSFSKAEQEDIVKTEIRNRIASGQMQIGG